MGTVAVAGGAAAVAGPFISDPAKAQTTVWKVQTSWPAGVGLATFKNWANSIKDKTGGELEFRPFAAKEVVGDFELLDGVRNGVLEAMNSFTLYWAGKLPATAFLSSYTLGLRYPHEWDVFFYSKNGLKMAREIFARQGLYYVGRIHHGPNIIHSKTPIRSIDDFRDLKLRVPGGMIAETFAAAGAKTTLLPGGEVFSALEKGTIDAADYTGPAVNWDLGFQQVTKFISMGPRGLESIYQPVDLMDLVVNMNNWNAISPKMQRFLVDEVEVYSALHHAAVQKADMEAWPKFQQAGIEVNRLGEEDIERFTDIAVPIWFKWANKDKDAARLFQAQLDIMLSPSFGYVTPDMIKDQKLEL
jgi:TRAP-type mannitol/chloroaromatic compound transport system substrate-binding protein